MSKYSIEKASMDAIADGVRWRTNRADKMTPAEMALTLKKNYQRNYKVSRDTSVPGEWERPADWPDLDSLNLEMAGDDFIYMTYDANQGNSAIAWHIETADKQPATLDIGHIENGVYIVDEMHSIKHNTNFVRWTDDLNGYIVLRITGQLVVCGSYNVSRNGVTQSNLMQPIVERIAWVPHLKHFTYSWNSYRWGFYNLERDKVANGDGEALTTVSYAWGGCLKLQNLDISGLKTPNMTSAAQAFMDCHYLKELDLRHWDVSNVTNVQDMFTRCRGLKHIDLRGWNTAKVRNFSLMFSNCLSLSSDGALGIWDFNTESATTFASMFYSCANLHEIHVENYIVDNATTFNSMFSECWSVERLDLSRWRPRNVEQLGSMFYDCYSLKELNFSGWQETGVIKSVYRMFYNCTDLENIDVSWIHLTNACVSMDALFYGCVSVKELNIPDDWDVSGLDHGNNTGHLFFMNCYSLEKITGITNWKFEHNNSLSSSFENCFSLRELDLSGWTVDHTTSLGSMFRQCYSLESINLKGWNPINCTNFSYMFSECYSLKELPDMTGWVTNKATTLAYMFNICESVEELPDIRSWDLSNVTSTAYMFNAMFKIREAELLDLSLPNCTTIANMFGYCHNLRRVKFTNWSIPKLNTAPAGFLNYCENLKDVEIFPIPLNHSYYSDYCLSHTALINILNSLPVVSTRRTLNLTTQNINRLTAEEKAIAANKNWTLAN